MNFLKDFQTEIKAFLVVAVVAAILVVGAILLLRAMQHAPAVQTLSPAPSLESQQEITTEKVTIVTDKMSYEQGETVKIIVQNDLDQSIGYWDYSGQFTPRFNIQTLRNGKWEDIERKSACACNDNCITYANGWVELKSRNSVNDSWDTKKDCVGIVVVEGKYRALFFYSFDLTGQGDFTTIYSNEFEIKEQAKAVDSSKILAMLTYVPEERENFVDRYVALSSLDITTGGKTELTRWAACEATVVLSPDKNRVAYFVTPNEQCEKRYYEGGYTGRTQLWIYDISSNKKELAIQSLAFIVPKWSPDGRYIAYERIIEHPFPQGREYILLIYDTQKKTEQSLGSFFGRIQGIIGFSPDNKVVYYADREAVYKVDVASQNKEVIYTHQGFEQSFLLSPGGSSIVVFRQDIDYYGGKTDYWGIGIGAVETATGEYSEFYRGSTQGLTILTTSQYEKGPIFLLDNLHVIYGGGNDKGGAGLWMLNINTGERKELEGTFSSTLNGITPVALSIDGKLVLYRAWEGDTTHYFILSLSTGETKEVGTTSSALRFGEVQERLMDWLN